MNLIFGAWENSILWKVRVDVIQKTPKDNGSPPLFQKSAEEFERYIALLT